MIRKCTQVPKKIRARRCGENAISGGRWHPVIIIRAVLWTGVICCMVDFLLDKVSRQRASSLMSRHTMVGTSFLVAMIKSRLFMSRKPPVCVAVVMRDVVCQKLSLTFRQASCTCWQYPLAMAYKSHASSGDCEHQMGFYLHINSKVHKMIQPLLVFKKMGNF